MYILGIFTISPEFNIVFLYPLLVEKAIFIPVTRRVKEVLNIFIPVTRRVKGIFIPVTRTVKGMISTQGKTTIHIYTRYS